MGRTELSLLRAITSPWWGPAARAGEIVRVTVRGADFEVVKTISRDPDRARFRKIWSQMFEVEPTSENSVAGRFTYKLEILFGIRSSRWSYDPAGFVKLLAIWAAVSIALLYRLPSVGEFDALLGIDPR
jgi:hypothetical protein